MGRSGDGEGGKGGGVVGGWEGECREGGSWGVDKGEGGCRVGGGGGVEAGG